MDTVREGESGTNEENSIDIYTLSCVKYIAAEKLLHYTGSQGWQSVMTERGGEGTEGICV